MFGMGTLLWLDVNGFTVVDDEWNVYLAHVVDMMTPIVSNNTNGNISMIVDKQIVLFSGCDSVILESVSSISSNEWCRLVV